MRKATYFWTSCLIAVSLAAAAQATPIAWDSFATAAGGDDYDVGPIQYQNPTAGCGGFDGAWNGGTNSFFAQNGGLMHDLTPGVPYDGRIIGYIHDSGWANRRLSRAIDYAPTDGTYFMSALLQKDQYDHIDLAVGLAPLESSGWSFSSIQGTYIGILDGNISFLTTSTLQQLVPKSQVNAGETYFALMQFDYSTSGPDAVTATVYDGSSTQIANRTFSGLNLDGDIGRLGFITSDFSPVVAVDEWRFGTDLRDVMVSGSAADFDADGDVDGDDFLTWQSAFNTNAGGDADNDGDTDGDDFLIWQSQFGSGAGMANAVVPEPTTRLLCCVVLAMVGGWRNRNA